MLGIVFSIIAGLAMTFQGVFNTRLSEKIGSWEANVFVQGTGFLITLLVFMLIGNGNFKNIKDVNKLYLLGGVLGVIIIFTVVQSIKAMGPACAIAIILVAQLTSASLIDALGLFHTAQVKFGLTKISGIVIMIIGIIIFKWKC